MKPPRQIPIVERPQARVRERLVGLLHFDEPLGVFLHPIRRRHVGMVLEDHLLVRPFDIIEASALRDPQKLVETRIDLGPLPDRRAGTEGGGDPQDSAAASGPLRKSEVPIATA